MERSEIQGHLQLGNEFEASLEYMSPYLKGATAAKMWKQPVSTDEGTDKICYAICLWDSIQPQKKNGFLPCYNIHRPCKQVIEEQILCASIYMRFLE